MSVDNMTLEQLFQNVTEELNYKVLDAIKSFDRRTDEVMTSFNQALYDLRLKNDELTIKNQHLFEYNLQLQRTVEALSGSKEFK